MPKAFLFRTLDQAQSLNTPLYMLFNLASLPWFSLAK